LNHFLIYQNKKIFIRVYGSGRPVLLIHGFGEDGNIWNEIIDHLKDRYQLIVPDLPGSGKSEMVEDMSMEGLADVMMAVATAGSGTTSDEKSEPGSATRNRISEPEESKVPLAGLSTEANAKAGGFRGALIGHSMGGYIALAFAEKFPQAFSALGLFHSTAFADSEEKKATRRKGIAFIRENGAHEFLKTVIPNLFSPGFKEENPAIIQKFIADQHNFTPEALVSCYEAMIVRPDRTAVLQKAVEPVLFIMGKYDNAVPMDDVLKQVHLPEKSYIHILQNSGHMGMMEEKENSQEILSTFLNSI